MELKIFSLGFIKGSIPRGGGGLPLTAVRICYDDKGTILANFSAIEGRVFKQCAT